MEQKFWPPVKQKCRGMDIWNEKQKRPRRLTWKLFS
jgi:hypothetical protein